MRQNVERSLRLFGPASFLWIIFGSSDSSREEMLCVLKYAQRLKTHAALRAVSRRKLEGAYSKA